MSDRPTFERGPRRAYLPGGVDDVAVVLDAVMLDVLGEGVLDGGVVGLDKVVVDKLDDEGGFT